MTYYANFWICCHKPMKHWERGVFMIEFIDVTKKYGDNIGLEHANIKINKGDFVFLVGPSGAGKSTFIKLILREIQADSGQILVDGMDVTKMANRHVPNCDAPAGWCSRTSAYCPRRPYLKTWPSPWKS